MSWKYLNYDGLWENKKFSDENQLASIGLDWTRWFYLFNHNLWLIHNLTLRRFCEILSTYLHVHSTIPYERQLSRLMLWKYFSDLPDVETFCDLEIRKTLPKQNTAFISIVSFTQVKALFFSSKYRKNKQQQLVEFTIKINNFSF